MNYNLVAVLEHKYFKSSKEFFVTIDNCEVRFIECDANAIIMIRGDYKESIELFFNIDTLFFICFGTFPKRNSLKYNGENIARILNKFMPDSQFDFQPTLLSDINTLLNQEYINRLKEIQSIPLYSFEYVVSEAYSNLVTNHRLTLLLHTIDGFLQFTEDDIKPLKHTIKHTYKKEKVSNYLVKVHHICKNYIFPYESESKLLESLNIQKFDFMDTITSTRHWGSHLYEAKSDDKILFNGKDIMVYFYILYFAIRLFICEKIDIKFKSDDVISYYNLIRDYIVWLDNSQNHNIDDYKSINYKIKAFLSEIQKLSNSEE